MSTGNELRDYNESDQALRLRLAAIEAVYRDAARVRS
jgi:hypothetical protein